MTQLIQENSSLLVPRGLRFGAVRAGIKASGNFDLCAAVAEGPMNAAALFTRNQFVAAPVTVGRQHLTATDGMVQAVLVNAGNANCATGDEGMAACHESCAAAARTFGCLEQHVFPSSTGIIGVPLPAGKIVSALPGLLGELGSGADSAKAFAHAIMTTDTRPKTLSCSLAYAGGEVRILGFAKGAGMIAPQLVPHATMLVYLFTDLAISSSVLRSLLWPAADASFNCISIDGDTSTNDTVFLGATGGSGVEWNALLETEREEFRSALADACESLAKQIVKDGEGARHLIEINLTGAASQNDALTIARALANSPLVKTAWAGEDPNWGRLISTIGKTNVLIDPMAVRLAYGEHPVFEHGQRAAAFDAQAIHAYLKRPEYVLHVGLGSGEHGCRFWTCDLTAEYVRINADYST